MEDMISPAAASATTSVWALFLSPEIRYWLTAVMIPIMAMLITTSV